ncbi:hypothetical protein [Acinetobacter ursingii]|uniref:hypothetical protein n=1 Tax=Acinetobacter ursingii TaxID=108980 RepID=UPI00300B7CDC
MDIFIALGFIFTPIIIGIINIVLSIRTSKLNQNYIAEFYNNLIQYGNSQGEDYQTYDELLRESIKVQFLLGQNGVMYNYTPPYANYTYSSVQVIVNFLPELHKRLREENESIYPSTKIVLFYFDSIRECLIRFQGLLRQQENNLIGILKNPFKLFNYGIKTILHFPLYILASFGVITEDTSEKAFSNKFFNFLGALISMLGLLGTVITIVTGWKAFIIFLKDFI